jgi:4-hydroxybenzoate polyprenyltransferase/phosphoserine phosphatase
MSSATASPSTATVPLCVDLDGTLIKTDVLWESLAILLKHNPLYLLVVPFWALRGRAALKKEIAARTQLNAANLPYHEQFLEYLKAERCSGRKIILATAADGRLADEVARHVGLFDEVIASDGKTNVRGKNKGAALAERFGKKGFDYAGNSTVDLPVWEQARNAIVVNASEGLAQQAGGLTRVARVFDGTGSRLRAVIKCLRPHQWVKNLIIFVPLLTSHSLRKPELVAEALIALAAFCLCASGVYVLNDLWDVEADRHHLTKRLRPFASGQLPLSFGFVLAPLAFILCGIVTSFLPWRFGACLAMYFVLTTSYSWRVKKIALLDVFFLAGLYTIRLVAGHEATGIVHSFWLLAFSMFIFLSLALVKRFTELRELRQQNRHDSKGRGYNSGDLEVVAMLGIASGFLAVLVMALYVNSQEVRVLYRYPTLLLMMCPLLLYWVSRVWLIAHRGQMHDDPIVFAVKDPASYLVGALSLGVLWLATGYYWPS